MEFSNDLVVGDFPEGFEAVVIEIDQQGGMDEYFLTILNVVEFPQRLIPTEEDLVSGFWLAAAEVPVPVLFVRSADQEEEPTQVFGNLWEGVMAHQKFFKGRKTWLPTLGVGDERLTLENSYKATQQAVDNIHEAIVYKDDGTSFVVTVPNTEEGRYFMESRSADALPSLPRSREYYEEQFSDVVHAEGYYFQKARDLLDQLKQYNSNPGYIGGHVEGKHEAEGVPPEDYYQQLQDLWKKRPKEIRPQDFIEYLKEINAANFVDELYLLINEFIAQIDRNAWNKSEWNEQGRAIAKTGARQHHLISQFLEYACNGFSFAHTTRRPIMEKMITYLENPKMVMNIFSANHQRQITLYFTGNEEAKTSFHVTMIAWFRQFKFGLINEENRTCLYTYILYSEEVKQLWKTSTQEEDEQEEDGGEEGETDQGANKDAQRITQSLSSVRQSNDNAHADEDHLGFDADVKVMAALMALRGLDPPLAIALFGRWGTGKSFFMHHLQKRVNELATCQRFLRKGEDISVVGKELTSDKYCQGIAQIQFNAWSYLDSNLWAGLVSSIFDKLSEYLTDHTKSTLAKLKVQQKLTDHLSVLKDKQTKSMNRKEGLEGIRSGYEQEVGHLEKRIEDEGWNKLRQIFSIQPVLQSLYNKLEEEDKQVAQQLKQFKHEKVAEELETIGQFITNLQHLKKYKWVGIGSILLTVGIFALGWYADQLLPRLSSNLYLSLAGLTPFISSFLTGVSRHMNKVRKVTRYIRVFNEAYRNQEQVKQLADQARENIRQVNRQIEHAEKEVDALNKKIAVAEEALKYDVTSLAISSFINERGEGDAYKKHLGIISTIRRDFETLSEMFSESNVIPAVSSETDKERGDQLKKDRREIEQQFKQNKKLERIILYIDDLDRCPDNKVLEVLQAVHLLMAFPLFIVVVGVDKRCVNNALNYKNVLQYAHLTDASSRAELKSKFDIDAVKPNEYLEKIFQIPFQLLEAEEKGVHDMIDSLLEDQVTKPELSAKAPEKKPSPEPPPKEKPGPGSAKSAGQPTASSATNPTDPGQDKGGGGEGNTPGSQPPVSLPDLSLSPKEATYLKALSRLVGKSPRTVKRFINLYRLIRAHGSLEYTPSEDDRELLGIMFLLAVQIGTHGNLAQQLFKAIEELNKAPLATLWTNKDLAPLLKDLEKPIVLGPNTELVLQEELEGISADTIARHIRFVKRFSFGERVFAPQETTSTNDA